MAKLVRKLAQQQLIKRIRNATQKQQVSFLVAQGDQGRAEALTAIIQDGNVSSNDAIIGKMTQQQKFGHLARACRVEALTDAIAQITSNPHKKNFLNKVLHSVTWHTEYQSAKEVLDQSRQDLGGLPPETFFSDIKPEHWAFAEQNLKQVGAKLSKGTKGVSLPRAAYQTTPTQISLPCSFIKWHDGKIYALHAKDSPKAQRKYLGQGAASRVKFAMSKDGHLCVYRSDSSGKTEDKTREITTFFGADGENYLSANISNMDMKDFCQIFYDMAIQIESEMHGHGDVKTENMTVRLDVSGKPRAVMIDRDLKSKVQKRDFKTTYGAMISNDISDYFEEQDETDEQKSLNENLNALEPYVKRLDRYAFGVNLLDQVIKKMFCEESFKIRRKCTNLFLSTMKSWIEDIINNLDQKQPGLSYTCVNGITDMTEERYNALNATLSTLQQSGKAKTFRQLLELSLQCLSGKEVPLANSILAVEPSLTSCVKEAESKVIESMRHKNMLLLDTKKRETYFLLTLGLPPVLAEKFSHPSYYKILLSKATDQQLVEAKQAFESKPGPVPASLKTKISLVNREIDKRQRKLATKRWQRRHSKILELLQKSHQDLEHIDQEAFKKVTPQIWKVVQKVFTQHAKDGVEVKLGRPDRRSASPPRPPKLGRNPVATVALSITGDDYQQRKVEGLSRDEVQLLNNLPCSFFKDSQDQIWAIEHGAKGKFYLGRGSNNLAKFAFKQDGHIACYRVGRSRAIKSAKEKPRTMVPFLGAAGESSVGTLSIDHLGQYLYDCARQLIDCKGHADFKAENTLLNEAGRGLLIDLDLRDDLSSNHIAMTRGGYKEDIDRIMAIMTWESDDIDVLTREIRPPIQKLDVFSLGYTIVESIYNNRDICPNSSIYTDNLLELHLALGSDDIDPDAISRQLDEVIASLSDEGDENHKIKQLLTLVKEMVTLPADRISMHEVFKRMSTIFTGLHNIQDDSWQQVERAFQSDNESLNLKSLVEATPDVRQEFLKWLELPPVYVEQFSDPGFLASKVFPQRQQSMEIFDTLIKEKIEQLTSKTLVSLLKAGTAGERQQLLQEEFYDQRLSQWLGGDEQFQLYVIESVPDTVLSSLRLDLV